MVKEKMGIIPKFLVDEYFDFFSAIANCPLWIRRAKNKHTYEACVERLKWAAILGKAENEILMDFFEAMVGKRFHLILSSDVQSVILAKSCLLGTLDKDRPDEEAEYTGCRMRCKCCGKMTIVEDDHILPIEVVGVKYYSRFNHQPLCSECNHTKSTTISREDVETFLEAINIISIIKEAA